MEDAVIALRLARAAVIEDIFKFSVPPASAEEIESDSSSWILDSGYNISYHHTKQIFVPPRANRIRVDSDLGDKEDRPVLELLEKGPQFPRRDIGIMMAMGGTIGAGLLMQASMSIPRVITGPLAIIIAYSTVGIIGWSIMNVLGEYGLHHLDPGDPIRASFKLRGLLVAGVGFLTDCYDSLVMSTFALCPTTKIQSIISIPQRRNKEHYLCFTKLSLLLGLVHVYVYHSLCPGPSPVATLVTTLSRVSPDASMESFDISSICVLLGSWIRTLSIYWSLMQWLRCRMTALRALESPVWNDFRHTVQKTLEPFHLFATKLVTFLLVVCVQFANSVPFRISPRPLPKELIPCSVKTATQLEVFWPSESTLTTPDFQELDSDILNQIRVNAPAPRSFRQLTEVASRTLSTLTRKQSRHLNSWTFVWLSGRLPP